MNIFTRFFTQLLGGDADPQDIERELIRRESEIGRQLFGPIPAGTKREFFRLNHDTWVWHEESSKGVKNTKYVVREKEVVKSINGGNYTRVSIEEAERLLQAAKLYVKRTNQEIFDPMLKR